MTFIRRCASALLLLGWAAACQAQGATPASGAAKAAQAPAPAASGSHPGVHPTQLTVIEDDGVRIEETRQRGATRRVVVQSKVGGVREYEIQVAPAGRDPAQERGGAGKRAWSLLNF